MSRRSSRWKAYKVDFTQNMTPNTTWRLYAVPIAEDGTIGKVTYEDDRTPFGTRHLVFIVYSVDYQGI